MQTRELRGGARAGTVREKVRAEAEELKRKGINPRMVAVLLGDDPSIRSYLEVKSRAAEKLGILLETVSLPKDMPEPDVAAALRSLGEEKAVHGIILELPLPGGINTDHVISSIPALKDVDGLTAANLGLLLSGREEEALVSATAQACVLLAEDEINLSGARAVVLGKGRTVGKPLIPMLLNRGATVTAAHSRTTDLRSVVKDADVIFCGVGKPGVLNASIIQEGQIVIDAGTTYLDGKLSGDASLDIWGVAGAATPVPEGVGPLTTALVFQNLLKAIKLQNI